MPIKRPATVLLCLAFLLPLASRADDACGQVALKNEHKDAATIQVLETAWSVAYLQGDTDLERCLLTPDFAEILRSGEMRTLAGEMANAAKNKGKNLPIPTLPQSTVLIHGDVAVAYSLSQSTDDGKAISVRNADYYVWEDGDWHAYFSQQTQF